MTFLKPMSNKLAVTPLDPERYTCCVGFDPAHDSYFVYVARIFKGDDSAGEGFDGHPVLWVGTKHQEIDSVEDLAVHLKPFAELPESLYQTLRDLRLSKARPKKHK